MQLSIIIINYKSPELIIDCLTSIYAETKGISYEILIVDNHSQDNSKQLIMQQYPEVTWIEMPYNSGFSRANNAGIKVAKGQYVLLLNSDTIILEKALDKVIRNVEQDKNVVAASVQLLNADLTPQNAGNYFVKGGLNILLTLPIINIFIKKIALFLKVKKPSIVSSSTINYVDWISGAFMLVRKSVINNSGLMDEDFFLFSEEIEWCSRLRKCGEIVVYADIKTIHLEGGTTKKLATNVAKNYFEYWTPKGAQLMLSNLLRIRKQYSIFWMFCNFMFYIVEIPIILLATFLSSKYTFANVKAYTKNVVKMFKYIPIIIRNKSYFYKIMS